MKLGDTAKATGVEFAVTKVEARSQLGAAGGTNAGPTETFVVVWYTLKNTGTAPMGFMDRPAISLIDASGQAYSTVPSAASMASDGTGELSGMTEDLNPNISAKTLDAWKVDKAAFDKGTWKLIVASHPQLTFALK